VLYRTIAEATPVIRAIYPPVSVRQANRIKQWADDLQRRISANDPEKTAIALFQASFAHDGNRWFPRTKPTLSEAAPAQKQQSAPKPAPKAKGKDKAATPAQTAQAKAAGSATATAPADSRTTVGAALVAQALISEAGITTFWAITDGTQVKAGDAREVANKGLILVTPQNTIRLTESGKALLQAAQSGNVQAAVTAMQTKAMPTTQPPAPVPTAKPKPSPAKESRKMDRDLPDSTDLLLEAATPAEGDQLAEMDSALRGFYVPWGVTSFKDLQAARTAETTAEEMRMLSVQYQRLMENILGSDLVTDKIAALQTLHEEFMGLLKQNQPGNPADLLPVDDCESSLPDLPSEPLGEGEFYMREFAAPTGSGMVTTFAEAAGGSAGSTMAYITAQIIEPGWGNPVDGHFYPAEVVKRDANKFIGAKMHESEHGPDKTNRTWVSTVTDIVGYTESGAPVAKIAVHDPIFAEKVRNLNEAGLLGKLQCSILAGGKARPGFTQGGRTGRLVESIDRVLNVDWVNNAGAGGKALNLAENSKGGNPPVEVDNSKVTPDTTTAAPAAPVTAPATPPADTLQQETLKESTQPATPPTQTPARLPDERVRALLAESNLPRAAQDKLSRGLYNTEAEVGAAINSERSYLSEATGSGKPVGMGEALAENSGKTAASVNDSDKLAEVNKAASSVNNKFMGSLR
jgi:hypothetical protein